MFGRTLTIDWIQVFGSKLRMELLFENGLAGIVAVDESTYQSTTGLGLPARDMFDDNGFTPIPWPAWKESNTTRARLYGGIGEVFYKCMDSYYLVGSDTVLLIDIADCQPIVTLKP